MRKYLISLSLALLLSVSSLMSFSSPTAEASSPSSVPKDSIQLPKVSPDQAKVLNEMVKKKKRKPVKELTSDQLNKLKNLPANTSVSSYGKIVTPKQQMAYLQDHPYRFPSHPKAKAYNLFNGDFQTEATDNRRLISPTTSYPYNAIAQLLILRNGQWYLCSGWFIDNNSLVTAAHCVYDTYRNQPASEIIVNPARDGLILPYGSSITTEFYVPVGWINTNPPSGEELYYNQVEYDYAVINVNESYNNWFQIRYSNQTNGEGVNSTGYPADKGGDYMYSSLGTITSYDATYGVITHTCYVTGGMSGGPLFNSKNGTLAAVGLNSTTVWGTQMTQNNYNTLRYWAGL